MDQAVEGLALEYRTTFLLFLSGVFSYFLCFMLFFAVDYDAHYGWADLILHLVPAHPSAIALVAAARAAQAAQTRTESAACTATRLCRRRSVP